MHNWFGAQMVVSKPTTQSSFNNYDFLGEHADRLSEIQKSILTLLRSQNTRPIPEDSHTELLSHIEDGRRHADDLISHLGVTPSKANEEYFARTAIRFIDRICGDLAWATEVTEVSDISYLRGYLQRDIDSAARPRFGEPRFLNVDSQITRTACQKILNSAIAIFNAFAKICFEEVPEIVETPNEADDDPTTRDEDGEDYVLVDHVEG